MAQLLRTYSVFETRIGVSLPRLSVFVDFNSCLTLLPRSILADYKASPWRQFHHVLCVPVPQTDTFHPLGSSPTEPRQHFLHCRVGCSYNVTTGHVDNHCTWKITNLWRESEGSIAVRSNYNADTKRFLDEDVTRTFTTEQLN